MNGLIIDSDVLIDVLRQDTLAIVTLQELQVAYEFTISAIVRMELVIGSNSRESLQRTEKLLRRFRLLPLTEEIGQLADQLITTYALSNGLRLADALIAATALAHDAPLLSKNQRDYRYLPGLKLLPYPVA